MGIETQGLGDAGTWDAGTWGRRNSGMSGRKDVINKEHLNFGLNFQFAIFGGQEKGMLREFANS